MGKRLEQIGREQVVVKSAGATPFSPAAVEALRTRELAIA